jgi:hypothetical protein
VEEETIMSSLEASSIVFVLVFSGAPAGMVLRRALPDEHFGTDAKDTVRLAIGLIVTMTGLVLGMLVSSAKTYYDGQKNVVAEMSSEIITLNSLLTDYGPETRQTRIQAHQFVEDALNRIWPAEKSQLFQLKPTDNAQDLNSELRHLVPRDERQASVKIQVSELIRHLKKTYWLMFLESEQASMSRPLLIVVTSWLIAIFVSFGIFAPPNATVIVTLMVCALAVAAAIFIIMEMYAPFGGVLKISSAVVRDALRQMATDQ